eukprot:scaffold535_cov260-Pinguiococcus_pyrenoidosus.AAC.21
MSLFNEIAGDQEPVEVMRNGRWIRMDCGSLVPGDIVAVTEGQRFPADVRILRCGRRGLRCDVTDVVGTAEDISVAGRSSEEAADAGDDGLTEGDLDVEDSKFVPLGALCELGGCRAVKLAAPECHESSGEKPSLAKLGGTDGTGTAADPPGGRAAGGDGARGPTARKKWHARS